MAGKLRKTRPGETCVIKRYKSIQDTLGDAESLKSLKQNLYVNQKVLMKSCRWRHLFIFMYICIDMERSELCLQIVQSVFCEDMPNLTLYEMLSDQGKVVVN
eukprot:TRINITY_DN706_c0_g1_i21.p1 TRINITY_DN706_c0_g1~~TRINITY_DN706_c0_g1_i21.p1  ORF type:complete len:102 (-),score=5.63 TRINITY_DN706_c0_g1_i21:223-528(-)